MITGRVMFFLLRMTFWLCVVCVLLPGGTQSNAPEAQIDAAEAVTLASAAMSDVQGFCARQPEACVVGGKVATVLGHKAEAGARTLYEFILARIGDATSDETTPVKLAEVPMTTGSTPANAPRPVPVSAREMGTLKPADMKPMWRGPVPLPPTPPLRREARASGPSA